MKVHELIALNKRVQIFFECKGVSRWDSEDLVQDVYCKLLSSGKDIQSLGLAYIYTSARNALIDKWRRSQCDPLSHVSMNCSISDEIRSTDDSNCPVYCYREEQVMTRFSKAIESFTPRQRYASIKSKFDNIPIKQIAREQNISVSAVEKQLAKVAHRVQNTLKCSDDTESQAA